MRHVQIDAVNVYNRPALYVTKRWRLLVTFSASPIRLWRSLKYEAIYLHELTDGFKADRVIGEWIDFYNTARPHSALGGGIPAEELGALGAQTGFDISQTLAVGELRERHAQVLIETGKALDLVVAVIARDAATEAVHGKVIDQL